jgi:hypothetical protein
MRGKGVCRRHDRPAPGRCERGGTGISRSHGYELIAAEGFPAKVITVGRSRRLTAISFVRLLERDD